MKKKDIETQENFSAECGQVYEKTKKEKKGISGRFHAMPLLWQPGDL